jgi:simple sugar transport system permease protein
MIIGALTCAVTANLLGEFEPIVSMLVIVIAGCLSGGIFALLCASLQVYLRVPILISSLLFNYIINLFASYLAIFPLRDKSGGSGVAQTAMIAEHLRLPVLLQGTRLHLGVVFILLLPLIAYWLFKKTVLGYEMSMSGINPDFAECSGIQMKRNLMLTMFISGCIGGLAGVVQVLGVDYRYRDGIIFSTGYAWTGFIAAQLTSFEPLPILLTGSFLSALSVGAAGLQRNTIVPAQLVDVVQAVIIFMFALREKTTNFLKSKLGR